MWCGGGWRLGMGGERGVPGQLELGTCGWNLRCFHSAKDVKWRDENSKLVCDEQDGCGNQQNAQNRPYYNRPYYGSFGFHYSYSRRWHNCQGQLLHTAQLSSKKDV